MTSFYLNLFYNEVCFEGTAMFYLCLHNINMDNFLYRPLRCWGILFDLILYVRQQFFSYVETGLPGLNQY